jgi:hypothetical protein
MHRDRHEVENAAGQEPLLLQRQQSQGREDHDARRGIENRLGPEEG